MEALIASAIAVLVGTGVYLLLRPRSFETVLGLTLLSYGVNLFIFAMGRVQIGRPAIAGSPLPMADPLPQALVLTAIVIGFAMTALMLVLALRSYAAHSDDAIDADHRDERAADGEGERTADAGGDGRGDAAAMRARPAQPDGRPEP